MRRDTGRIVEIVDIEKYVVTSHHIGSDNGSRLGLGDLVNSVSDMVELIQSGANSLFQQHKYSNGYFSKGDSEIAEANIVVHVASPFIANNHAVWAESPFKNHRNNKCKHLDLLIDFDPEKSEHPTVLVIEAKRITHGEEDKKVAEILTDYERMKSWGVVPAGGRPLFFELAPEIERLYGAIVVVLPQSCNKQGEIPDMSFPRWWVNPKGAPEGYSKAPVNRLPVILKTAAKKGLLMSKYRDGGIRLVVLYAVFAFGSNLHE